MPSPSTKNPTGIVSLKCQLCKKGHYALPVHMIELAATQEITPSNCPLAKKNPSRFLPGVLLE
jgi:hypothetical protein